MQRIVVAAGLRRKECPRRGNAKRYRLSLANRKNREEPADVVILLGRSRGEIIGRQVIGSREPASLAFRRNGRVLRNRVQQRRQLGGQYYPVASGRKPAQQLDEGVLKHISAVSMSDVKRSATRST